MICKGDGTLYINPEDGDVKWAWGALETWCRQNWYVDMMSIAGYCGIDVPWISPGLVDSPKSC